MKKVNNSWSQHAEGIAKREQRTNAKVPDFNHNLPRIWSWTGTTNLHLVKLVWSVWSWTKEAVWSKMKEIEKENKKQQLNLWIGPKAIAKVVDGFTCLSSSSLFGCLLFGFLLLPYVALDRPTRRFSVVWFSVVALRGTRPPYEACLCLFNPAYFTLVGLLCLYCPVYYTLLV